jgi:hypothetical protein
MDTLYISTYLWDIPSFKSTQGKQYATQLARELRRASPGFRKEREPLAASHTFGDRVTTEDNSQEVITKQTNKIAK